MRLGMDGRLAAHWLVLVACMVAGGPPRPAAGGLPAVTREPLPTAQRHLRRAREYLAASCEMLTKGSRHAVDGYYVACQEAWNAVWVCPAAPEILHDAADLYADALAGLLEAARRHGRLGRDGLWIGPRGRPLLVPFRPAALPIGAGEIVSLEPQAQRDDRRISRRHLRAGFGLPVVVRTVNRPPEAGSGDFTPPRQSLAATAVLRFDVPGNENALQAFAGPAARDHAAAVLDLANPVEIAAVHIGPARPHLAADLTAPLLDMLDGAPRSAIAGFLQPFGRGDTRPHLEFIEPHRPGRVPVVFIHGLASDEGTWFDMLNELRAWPLFHRRFEAWIFHYPTGGAFLRSSAVLRRELTRAVQELDPSGGDPAMRNLVLVGHSMGGLHAKLQVVSSGDALWNEIATVPFDTIRLRPDHRAVARETYFFEPLPFVNRVVCIATPHRGSILASLGVGRLASLSVRQPPETRAIHEEAVRLNPGAFRPDFERSLPTSIDILEPDSAVLQTVERLRPSCRVTMHSIVGTGHHSLVGGRDDCVVSAGSAHTAGAVSEIEVPATHTKVHHHPLAIGELQRILVQHLRETGLADPPADAVSGPRTTVTVRAAAAGHAPGGSPPPR